MSAAARNELATCQSLQSSKSRSELYKPRLGFLGTGWIGRMRMEALLTEDIASCVALHDPVAEAAQAAAELATEAHVHSSLESLLADDLDGIVIATPSALHPQHCIAALRSGKAVFCQKPLARTRQETEAIIQAAREANKLLAVDFSYRHLAGVRQLRHMIHSGELGEIFAADLTFHNAYGPDKAWFHDVGLAGGGCVIDLGVHLADLLLWLLRDARVEELSARLYKDGQLLQPPYRVVEDYADIRFRLGAASVRLCCSWNLHAGRDAVIEASLYGTSGGGAVRNVNGSFYDFEVLHLHGTGTSTLGSFPDAWGGRALATWTRQLARSDAFDPAVEQLVQVADIIDRIYRR